MIPAGAGQDTTDGGTGMSDAGLGIEEIRDCYGEAMNLSVQKVIRVLDQHARAFIERSPFLTLATCGANGDLDVSPRGDPAGFVKVLDDRTLAIPDRPGNRRLDSITNVAETERVALLFLIPGFDDTLRVNGRAKISRDPELLQMMVVQGKPALSAIVVTVEEVYMHCAKAFIRSRLWKPDAIQDRRTFPSLGQIIADQVKQAELDVAETDRSIDQGYRENLY